MDERYSQMPNNYDRRAAVADPLTQHAVKAFMTLRRPDDTPAETSTSVAYAVGAHAFRLGMSEQDLIRWLQSAYSGVWVRQSNLNPGLDAKDVRKALLKAYQTAARRGRRSSEEAGLRKAIIRLAHEKPELRPHLLPLVKEAAGELPMRHLTEMLKGAHDIIVMHATDSKVQDQVFKMVLRFQRNLERRGIRLRDPKGLAEDLLYAASVDVTWKDMHGLKDTLSSYVYGADASDLGR